MGVTSLLDLVQQLLNNGEAAHDFRAHPDRFLADHGLHDLSGHDVIDALKLGFDSVHPDLAQRIVLPDDPTHHHVAAADAFNHLLDAAPEHSVLADAHDVGSHHDVDLGHGFGLGHDVHHGHDATFGAGHDDGGGHEGHGHVADLTHLALDLGAHMAMGPEHDLGISAFDQGFGHGAHHVDVDHLHDVDDLHGDTHHVDEHAHDPGHGPH
jgi:hypothetical protein